MIAGYHETKGEVCDGGAEPEHAVQETLLKLEY